MIVVFDAQCLLCNGWVRFLLRHDPHKRLRFASIQGAQGQALLSRAGLQVSGLDTLLVVDGGRSWQHTTAIIRVLDRLGGPWRLAWAAWLIPAVLRDPAYRLVARNRYRWFGRSDTCLLPHPDHAGRFLDQDPAPQPVPQASGR
jgi:predicted DCC family thiol-disulfide oxidoreductase YuxK